jgi:DnaK suppressor protein
VKDPLLAERDAARAQIAALTREFDQVVDASRQSNADDEHDPEGATIAFERSQIGSLVRQVQQRLVEIEAAVGRLDSGTYGICEGCGEEIGDARLEARPVAATCIRCAAADRH